MMKLFKILLVAFAVSLCSCSRKSVTSSSKQVTVVKDSVSFVETLIYDTIILPADTLIQTFTIECDSLTNKPKPLQVSQKSGRSTQTIVLNNKGVLTAYCQTDSLLHIITGINRELAIYKALAYTKDDSVTSYTVQYRTPKWVWYSLTINGILVLYTFRKPLINLIRLAFI